MRASTVLTICTLLCVVDTGCSSPSDVSEQAAQQALAGAEDPATTAPGFINLAPPLGEPLDARSDAFSLAAPPGWTWHEIDGAACRDGSPAGFFVHTGSADSLLIYLEGGGACSNGAYCDFNPASVNQALSGDGQTVIGSAIGAIPGRQRPGVYTDANHLGAPAGIFEFGNAQNPVKDWSQVYIPYCTGDVFYGSKKTGSVPGLSNQQFVGYENMKLFMSRLVPTFRENVSRVVLAGASAGAFGVALNFSMVQDSFGEIPVDAVIDSGPTFADQYMPVCMQKRWRESWGFDDSFPPDCSECRQADGGGLGKIFDFVMRKHPRAHIALISTMQDEVIRLFYSVGLQDCANYDTVSPLSVTLFQLDPNSYLPAQTYSDGLTDLRNRYAESQRFASFYIAGVHPNYHQHIFRAELYAPFNGTTQAAFLADFLDGKVVQLGP